MKTTIAIIVGYVVWTLSWLAGNAGLVIEPIDQTNAPRKSWNYNREFRRVFRNPWQAYDFPAQYSDGLRTVDDFWLYSGPPDRYEWKLLGKRELLMTPTNEATERLNERCQRLRIRAGEIDADGRSVDVGAKRGVTA